MARRRATGVTRSTRSGVAGRGVAARAIGSAAILAGSFFLAGCAGTRPIGHLLDDPYRFDGKVVRVEGRVSQAAGALGYGAYRIDDGTGALYVVSDGRGVPREGARVRVKGRFESVLTVGRTSVAGLLEKRRRPAR